MEYWRNKEQNMVNIGGGAFTDAYASDEWDWKTPRPITLLSKDSNFRYDYLLRLGLIIEPIQEYENGYVYSVPFLERAEYNESIQAAKSKLLAAYNDYEYHYRYDVSKRSYGDDTYTQAAIYAIIKLYKEKFLHPMFEDLIELMYEYRTFFIKFNFDMHDGNFRQCPITGKIFIYDPIAIWEKVQ